MFGGGGGGGSPVRKTFQLFDRKKRACDCRVLEVPLGFLVLNRLDGILEKNTTAAQLHTEWAPASQSQPQKQLNVPLVSRWLHFFSFPGFSDAS